MSKGQGEGLKHRLKTLLRLKKTHTIPTIGHENEEEQEYIFTVDKLKELHRENNVNHRGRVLKELCEIVASRKLEEHATEAVWNEIGDMFQASTPTEPRQSALRFLVCLAEGQAQRLGILRAQFLRLIENHAVKEDLSYRIDLLIALTVNGKDVSYCEHFGPFLLVFTTEVLAGDRTEEFLMFLINLLHYNSSFLDKEIITGLVERTCDFCNKAKAEKDIESCLQLLDATVRYSGLPSDGLYPLIATLCRTVNIERFCEASWKLMKTLVGTRLGHSAIYIVCCILEDENNMTDSILLRGAVFFIGMCIWGSKRVASLQHKPISLLPSFKQALHCNHPIVAHEIGLSLQRLVKKYGKNLQIVTWDIILDLVEMLIKLQQNLPGVHESLKRTIHDLLTTIEDLYSAGKFDGPTERFFAIIEQCSSQRPDSSVLTLLSFLHEGIHPAKDGWLETLQNVMEKYFRKETRTAIRVKVLDILSAVLTSYRFWYEEELIELAVLSYLNDIDKEKDPNVRLVTAQLLVDLLSTFTSNKCLDILAILKKLINRLMDSSGLTKRSNDDQLVTDGEHLRDIKIAVNGLIDTFKQKLVESPTVVAIKIIEILVEHVSLHYVNGFTAQTGAGVRLEIFRLFLNIRADERHRIGVIQNEDGEEENEVKFSVFATCKPVKSRDHNPAGVNPLGRKSSLTKYCPTLKTFEATLNCLKDEWEWGVLQYVLLSLPDQLRNKTLILGGGSDVRNLCVSLCCMVNDGQFLNKLKNVPSGSGRTDLHNFVFPILGVLVTYHDTIEEIRQFELVKSLELGLNSQCARLCVICLTICILEMKLVMLRTIPSILIKLSKISATVPMSIPMLEFLSSLKEITELYSNFVEEQYMSIFAIALPYTDAHRYSQYTVTLAHYVIASWFTRCRLSFRKGFVRLITKGLQSSAITRPTQSIDKQATNSKVSIAETHEFHEDMTEVCSDMMAKYSFSTISNQPKRSSVAQFLLANGSSQSWLVGNTLVTVTTSGSSNDCAACVQKKAKQTANKAAAKLRLLNMSADEMLESESELSLSRAIEASNGKTSANEVEHVKMDHISVSNTITDAGPKQKQPVKQPKREDELIAEPKRYPDQYTKTQAVLVCDVIENEAVENIDQRKDSRVDSAVEVMEDSEPYKNIDVIDEETVSIHPELADGAHQELEKTEDELEVSVTACSSEEGSEESPEISLVNRLALEQQNVGQMFSPTHYFLNEMSSLAERGISATSSMEFEKDEADTRQSDAQHDEAAETTGSMSTPTDKTIPESKPTSTEKQPQDLEATEAGKETVLEPEGKIETEVRENKAGQSVDANENAQGSVLEDSGTQFLEAKTSAKAESFTEYVAQKAVVSTESPKEARDKKQRETGDYYEYMKQNFLRTQPASNVASQTSSTQASPLASKKASLQTSIELSSEYELVEEEDARSYDVKRAADMRPRADIVCSCSSQSWAEIMIRRPTGNTSWVMKMENALDPEKEFGGIEDIASLAAAMEVDDFSHDYRELSESNPEGKTMTRPRFLSTVTDDLIKERQINTSSSNSPKSFVNEATCDSPNTYRRRRFSTGSLDIPGAFTFSLPSPDQSKEKDDVSEVSFGAKYHYHFEKPSVGFSPMSSLRRAGSTNSIFEAKDKASFSFDSLVLPSSCKSDVKSSDDARTKFNVPGYTVAFDSSSGRFTTDTSKKPQLEKKKLSKTLSSPTKTSPTRAESQAETSNYQRSSSTQPKSVLAESISKDAELQQKRIEGIEKHGKPASATKPTAQKSVAGIIKKDGTKTARSKDGSHDNQPGISRKNAARTEEQKTTAEQAVSLHPKENIKSEGQKNTGLTFKDGPKKEPLKAGAQALKEKISSFSAYRPRGKTISTYPVSKPLHYGNSNKASIADRSLNAPLNPYFVFLQFFYSPFISAGGSARPLLLNSGEVIDRAVKMLDRIPPYNYHKIGVIYVGAEQQSHETCILANQYGSSRYIKFLHGIGKLISLLDCAQTDVYTGGLDRNGADGKFAYSWRDSITQVIFHVATLMPNKQSDPACNSKKLHIGNNFVTIVYNDSNKPYKFGTIKGQFNFAEVVIKPLDFNSNLVNVRMKEDLRDVVTNTGPHVISDDKLPILVRQLAVHTNMATVLHYSKNKPSDAYGCNWLERLKQIKRIRSKAVIEHQGPMTSSNIVSSKGTMVKQTESTNSDFTDYT